MLSGAGWGWPSFGKVTRNCTSRQAPYRLQLHHGLQLLVGASGSMLTTTSPVGREERGPTVQPGGPSGACLDREMERQTDRQTGRSRRSESRSGWKAQRPKADSGAFGGERGM